MVRLQRKRPPGESSMVVRSRDMTATLMELADTLVSDFDLLDYLDLLLTRSAAALGTATGGVMLRDPAGVTGHDLELLACTDERTRIIELFELQRQEGPCVDSHKLGAAVVEEDLATAQRWPMFAPMALER